MLKLLCLHDRSVIGIVNFTYHSEFKIIIMIIFMLIQMAEDIVQKNFVKRSNL
jgi:hypothetical protein